MADTNNGIVQADGSATESTNEQHDSVEVESNDTNVTDATNEATQAESIEHDEADGEPETADHDSDALGEAGKRTLTKLRRENRQLSRENDQLREQIASLKDERHMERVTRLATGRLQYPNDAVKLLDGITVDSSDADVTKAIDALLKHNPGYGVQSETHDPTYETVPSIVTPKEARTRVNSARFTAQLAKCGV